MHIQELGRGRYSDCFKIFDPTSRQSIAMKLSYYQEATIRAFAKHAHHGDIDAATTAKEQDAISVSMAMAEVAKQFRTHRVSPHFVRVLCEADVRYLPKRLKPLLVARYPTLTPQQIKYSHVCLMHLYACNLTDLIERRAITDTTLRALIFQVLYTVACLQTLFPGFRHNDLSTNNVLVKPINTLRCTRYQFQNRCFYIGGVPYAAAIADFDFTHVPGHDVLSNERVLSGKYTIGAEPNSSYDTHLFLKSVKACILRRSTKRFEQTREFLHGLGLDPCKDRITNHMPHLKPARLLTHRYFDPLRTQRPCSEKYGL